MAVGDAIIAGGHLARWKVEEMISQRPKTHEIGHHTLSVFTDYYILGNIY
jgi:hypothetical protein